MYWPSLPASFGSVSRSESVTTVRTFPVISGLGRLVGFDRFGGALCSVSVSSQLCVVAGGGRFFYAACSFVRLCSLSQRVFSLPVSGSSVQERCSFWACPLSCYEYIFLFLFLFQSGRLQFARPVCGSSVQAGKMLFLGMPLELSVMP